MEYVPFEGGIEINGQTVWSVVDGFPLLKFIPSKILIAEGVGEKGGGGIVKIDPEGWYSQSAWLRAFKAISAKVGSDTLYEIGCKIPENAIFPPTVVDVDSAIASIDIAYHMNHRKRGEVMFDPETGQMLEGIGHYGFERVPGENKIISVCRNPYPCHFDRGIVFAMARRFEDNAEVVHDDSKECRREGAQSCTYVVTW